jgi:hypothetical protein
MIVHRVDHEGKAYTIKFNPKNKSELEVIKTEMKVLTVLAILSLILMAVIK